MGAWPAAPDSGVGPIAVLLVSRAPILAARLVEKGTRAAKIHFSNLLPHEQKTGRHISNQTRACLRSCIVHEACTNLTVLLLFRAILLTAICKVVDNLRVPVVLGPVRRNPIAIRKTWRYP